MERQEFQHEALSPLVFCVIVPISLLSPTWCCCCSVFGAIRECYSGSNAATVPRRRMCLVYHAFPVVAQFCLDVNIAFGRVLFRACYSHSSAKQKLQYSNFRNHPRGHHFLPTFHSCRRSATDSMSLLFLGFIDNKSPSLAPSPLLPRPEAGEDMLIFSDISFN